MNANLFLAAQYLQKRELDKENNRRLLAKQVFSAAQRKGYISINGTVVTVSDPDGAINHFNHHPELFLRTPYDPNRLKHDTSLLNRTLSTAWQLVAFPATPADIRTRFM